MDLHYNQKLSSSLDNYQANQSDCGCPGCCQPRAMKPGEIQKLEPGFISCDFTVADTTIAGLTLGYSWTGNVNQAATVNYTVAASTVDGASEEAGLENGAVFNSTQLQAFREILPQFSNVANITFNEVSDSSQADIIARQGNLPEGIAGWLLPYFEVDQVVLADLVLDDSYNSPQVGDFGYLTLIHELGHAVGLGHPHDGYVLESQFDSNDYTVMSYNFGEETNFFRIPDTLMIYDILTLQHIYGANQDYNSGNTTIDVSDPNFRAFTIWDGGGVDTLDTSNYFTGAVVDLREGIKNITMVGEARAWIAFGSNIENANAGEGADSINGNLLNNTIDGNGGNDSINGNEGDDFISGGEENDVINGNAGNDYVNGNLGNDSVMGGKGNDTVHGGKDNDVVSGDLGNDYVNGNIGNDVVYGGLDNDTVRGGQDDDSIFGGQGDDLLLGDKGNDYLVGGNSRDGFVFNVNNDHDIIADFAIGDDSLYVASFYAANSAVLSSIAQVENGNLVFRFDDNNSITLEGITMINYNDVILF